MSTRLPRGYPLEKRVAVPMSASFFRAGAILPGSLALIASILSREAPAQTSDLRMLRLPQWTAERELVLGSADGPHDAFVLPTAPKLDMNGDIYVLDIRLPALLVFDSMGRFIRQLGSPGDGPGEYRSPAAFGIRGDTVWLGDMRNGRMTLFDRNGGVISTFRLGESAAGQVPQVPVDMLGPDQFLVITPVGPDLRNAPIGRVTFQQSFVRTDRRGTISDTVVTYVAEFPAIVTAPRGRGFFGYQPIRDGPVVSYDPRTGLITEIERRAAASEAGGVFRVSIRTSQGMVLKQRSFRYDPILLPRETRDSIIGEARRRATGRAADMLPVVMTNLYLPAFQPPVRSFVTAEDGTIWVEREPLPGGRVYLILDVDLNPMATVHLPATSGTVLSPITRTHFWAHELDDLDVPSLVRYRIRRQQ